MSPRVSGRRPGITKAVLTGAVAVTLATTLGLSACGSDDDADEASTSTSSASSTASSSSSATSAAASSENPEGSEDAGAEDAEGAEDADAENPDGAEPAPEDNQDGVDAQGGDNSAAGAPAGQDDAAQITALERGFAEDRTYSEYLRYTYEHTCNADLEQTVGGREAAMEDADANGELGQKRVSEVMASLPIIHGVNDIRVNGDRATANLDQTMNGNRQTLPKNYVREDGQWRTCIA
ncbi:hypothetical protein ACT3SZ_13685 [Corynebacterium sp. AOP40-9SA-29]|uniref:hypothetical protein n=1 Tax=Corynebacterium sp. AOP40-9SA-29 TaxID=3457677 RepID=UPI00403450DB